eukprot:CAMPEP_0175921474 /NCGR_PEP_ID=MMETSP0108-20121206/13485_1 /TAXON_ID=195067 ORGANISM="Goniomonas pacifica, Strain CCMP1869" /NCGR_SAMPLE_ID=MMETSP0108 /ASSEMBLY_ACC=CAM_ASM_000204 /LENGTH=34 /DNA_ID= /DNA_START= /DNA_END= /DNA_ORIENTATION=
MTYIEDVSVSMRVTCEYACHMVSRSDLDYITGVT